MRDAYLHETTEPKDGVIETAVSQIFLSACLHLHQWNLRVLVTVVDGEEHIPLDTHCLQQTTLLVIESNTRNTAAER